MTKGYSFQAKETQVVTRLKGIEAEVGLEATNSRRSTAHVPQLQLMGPSRENSEELTRPLAQGGQLSAVFKAREARLPPVTVMVT